MRVISTKQRQIIEFIKIFLKDHHYPPTIRDIVSGCGLKSTSVAVYNLSILEKKGVIRHHHKVSRGIELLTPFLNFDSQVQIPIIGQIAAGEPIPVPISDTWDVTASSETLECSKDLTQGRNGLYAL
ncbi:LexA family protein, partial [Chloroflexota bacterium]